MASIFTRIIDGELPGRFVWRDDRCAAFLSINPLGPGHTLVVPVDEVDHWIDLSSDDLVHVMGVAHLIARAQEDAFRPPRVGLMIAGFEVPHAHVHVVPIWSMRDLDFANAQLEPDPDELDRNADVLRAALQARGDQSPGVSSS